MAQVILLLPSYQFNDPAFRDFLSQETQTDFHFWAKDHSLEPALAKDRRHPLLNSLLQEKKAGFIVRTSGSSSARYKFVLHEAELFLKKYQKRGPHFSRTLAFSPVESIAGIETFLETVCIGASLVAAGDRLTPQIVSDLIQKHQVDYFQTTPTFLNLMLLSKKIQSEKLAGLKKIAYGSEPSLATSLEAIQKELPQVELNHTYGMSEIGIQITQTNPRDASTFLPDPLFNPGRLQENLIEIQSLTPMRGYLNASFLPDKDGWFKTFDQAREEKDYWRVLGRQGDLINLAGRKFFPSDLESLLSELSGLAEVTVIAEQNEMIGQAVIVKITLSENEDESHFRKRFKKFCEEKVPFFMHPQRLILQPLEIPEDTARLRLKKRRRL